MYNLLFVRNKATVKKRDFLLTTTESAAESVKV